MTSEVPAAPAAWLLARPGVLAPPLRNRAMQMDVVALTDTELDALVSGEPLARPADETGERRLLDLVASGASKLDIERALGLSSRTVDRRLQTLRTRFGARTYPELAAILAREGFGR